MVQRATIKIIRDDNIEFDIDGSTWGLLSDDPLDGFGDFTSSLKVTENAVGDGGVFASTRLSYKDRLIKCAALYPALNPILRRQATSFFNSKCRYKVYITHMGETRWCEGMVYKFNMPSTDPSRLMKLNVMFRCESPFLKSYDDFGKDISAVRGCGFPYLCKKGVGAPTGIFNFAKKVNIANNGDTETYFKVVFIASGEVKNPVIYTGDDYVRVFDDMEKDDVIEMDFAADPPTIKKNGTNCVGKCDRTSSFSTMVLNRGDNTIRYDAEDGSNLLTVAVYYNELYTCI